MEALSLAAFESRASEAEARLAALESQVLSVLAPGGATATAASSEELTALRDLLIQARVETEKLQLEKDSALSENQKLRYQIKHLKRAVVETEEKLIKTK